MLVGVSLGSYELLLGVALLSSKGTSNDHVDKKRSRGGYSYNSIKRTCSIKRPGLELFKKTLLNVPYHH